MLLVEILMHSRRFHTHDGAMRGMPDEKTLGQWDVADLGTCLTQPGNGCLHVLADFWSGLGKEKIPHHTQSWGEACF